jgi:hypothetical protein
MNLFADRYFIQSDAQEGDGTHLFDEVLRTFYHFNRDNETFAQDQEAQLDFDIFEWKTGRPPKKVKSFDHSSANKVDDWSQHNSISQVVYPGDILTIRYSDKGAAWKDICSPGIDPREDVCKEIKIFGIDKESDFGILLDPINIIGGTYYEVRGLVTNIEVTIVGYSILLDRKGSITETSQDILNSLISGKNFINIGSPFSKRNSLFISDLLPGNNYTVFALLSDRKGRWQIYSDSFTTKRREVYVDIDEIFVKHNGDGDGSGTTDARFQAHFSEFQLDKSYNRVGNSQYERLDFGQFSNVKSNSAIPFGSFFASQFGPTKVVGNHFIVIRSTAQDLDFLSKDEADTMNVTRPLAPYLDGFALPFNMGKNEVMQNAKFRVQAITDDDGPFEVLMTVRYNVYYS